MCYNENVARNWIQLVIGVWLIVSPWLLGFSSITVMKWGNMIAGLILVLINVWVIFGKTPVSSSGEEVKK